MINSVEDTIVSRTIRRKNKQGRDYSWVLRDWDWDVTETYMMRVNIDKNSERGRKALINYHRDGKRTMGPAPHWYCNIFERTARQEARRQLHLFAINPEDLSNGGGFMVMLEANHRRSASWCWW